MTTLPQHQAVLRSTQPGVLTGLADVRLETVRQLDPELQARVDQLAQRAREVDGGVSPFGEHKWLRLVRGDDRCAALLLWRHDTLVGAAHCDSYHTALPDHPCHLNAEMVIHPRFRRRGLGSLLIHAVLTHAREEYADEVHLWAYGNSAAAQRMARDVGFREERTLLQMSLPGELLPVLSEAPAGITVRPMEPTRDAYRWLALHNRVFAGHPEQESWDAADLQARFDQPWFSPRDLLIAEREGTAEMVGFCWVKLPTDREAPGEIYIVGVDPEVRGVGLGRYLTRAGLAHMRANNRPGATLYVESENDAAITLYRKLGFEPRWEHACYVRALRGA